MCGCLQVIFKAQFITCFRGVSGYLNLGGQVVMWLTAARGAFYSARNWVGNCPPCPPATYAPVICFVFVFKGVSVYKPFVVFAVIHENLKCFYF